MIYMFQRANIPICWNQGGELKLCRRLGLISLYIPKRYCNLSEEHVVRKNLTNSVVALQSAAA
jgi:hypothetical protein